MNVIVVNSYHENEEGNPVVKIARYASTREEAIQVAKTLALSDIGAIAFECPRVGPGMDIFYREGRIPVGVQ